MVAIVETLQSSSELMYGAVISPYLYVPIVFIAGYFIFLFISGFILYSAARVSGSPLGLVTGLSTAMFTIFIRDLIIIPLILITILLPFGFVIAIVIWLGLIKTMFKLGWVQAFVAFLMSLVIPFIILVFLIIPVAAILL